MSAVIVRQQTMKKTAATIFAVALACCAANAAPRAARSIHLGYDAPPAATYYNQMVIEKSVPGSNSLKISALMTAPDKM